MFIATEVYRGSLHETDNDKKISNFATDVSDNCNLYFLYLSSYHEKAIKTLFRARLGVAGYLFTTSRWGNPAKCLFQRHKK